MKEMVELKFRGKAYVQMPCLEKENRNLYRMSLAHICAVVV